MVADTALSVTGLTVRYGDYTAVDGLHLAVEAGSVTALLGMNGAGKTSTFSAIMGVIPVPPGVVTVAGTDVALYPARAKYVLGVQLQEASLWDDLTCGELVRLYAALYRCRLTNRQCAETLAQFGLEQHAAKRPSQLSGGEKRRLGIAIATAHNPSIVMLDEPTSGLDARARRSTWEFISALRERGTTVLLTTHYIEEAELLCDDIAILHHGHLIDRGTPTALIASLGASESLSAVGPGAQRLSEALRSRSEVFELRHVGSLVTCLSNDPGATVEFAATVLGSPKLTRRPTSVEDVFLARTGVQIDGEIER